MKNHLQAKTVVLLGIVLFTFTGGAQMIQPICSFTSTTGSNATCGLTLGPDGSFYGSTSRGNTNNGGTLFRVTTAGALTNLVYFNLTDNIGYNPYAPLTVGPDGNLYGSTRSGSASIFRLTTNGDLVPLSAPDGHTGYLIDGALAVGADSKFYGVATSSGFSPFDGTVFQMATNGSLSALFYFSGSNGATPIGGLTVGLDGYFYGTTSTGGTNGRGTLFKVGTNGALTTLIHFASTNGGYPNARLTFGPDGYIYGTTLQGGTNGDWGTAFKATTNGVVTLLHSFAGGNDGGILYAGLVPGGDGNYYGASYYAGPYNVGTVYRVSPGGVFTMLAAFNSTNGANPRGDLVLGPDGNFYGTTEKGGSSGGGVIYRLDLPPTIVIDLTNQTVYAGGNAAFTVNLFGTAPYSFEWLSNGVPVLVSTNSIFTVSNLVLSATANYQVIITNTWGSVTSSVAALTVALPPVVNNVWFVAQNSATNGPGTSWANAFHDIQSAVNVANNGDIVMVTNGVYNTGGMTVPGNYLTNRVYVTNAITLQSVNGPGVTIISGIGASAVNFAFTNNIRCVFMATNAVLSGFTLTNGGTRYPGLGAPEIPYGPSDLAGGGSYGGILTNCILTGNSAGVYGGGAYGGTLFNCLFANNAMNYNNAGSGGGGASSCKLFNCVLTGNYSYDSGGGAQSCTLVNCALTRNSGATYGGGAENCTLTNCLVSGNGAAQFDGGGADGSTLISCTVVGNTAEVGGGTYNCNLNNCVIYRNSAMALPNYYGSGTFNYCCTAPLPPGVGNITNDPAFIAPAAGNYRLQTNSPCIDTGNNAYIVGATDLDGRPRIVGGTVDMGCYEFQGPGMGEFMGWLQQYGLPTDGTADYADSDHTGMNNWQKWIAGLNPINPASVLAMMPLATTNVSTNGLTVSWQSVNNRTYYLLRSTNLSAFSSIRSNLVGQSGTTSVTDTTATNAGPYFYRVGIQ